ncbi:DNA-processing protein DprA [Altererythrobacter sp. TH136]|uniref:DNA-processing protein DprA n=1 Tax=Altererythrobacter sp. TH136 TaxID=2067415 RepID=UPI001FEE8010|nr:DNA-processing protein DprA [Altererythrobacter sp. TH136]
MPPLSTNTKAILLLTAPLIVGRGTPAAELLSPGEYKTFAQRLHELGCQPSDLLGPNAAGVAEQTRTFIDPNRLQQLLGRGLQLGQAVDRWRQRAIWVVSRADSEYPKRLKARLRSQAPALLYGCGEVADLNRGGLAVVGSRHVDDELTDYAIDVGSLAAQANRPIVSGGARGIDQAAMRGALEAGGRVCGVLTDSLERQVMTREHRDMLLDGQLILVSPYDPNAGFNRGHAMQRNKIVYALADAALVVSSDVEKGGTWAGAIEQLRKLKLVRVYVRSTGTPQRGLDALLANGAIPWPNPTIPSDLRNLLDMPEEQRKEGQLPLATRETLPGSSEPAPITRAEHNAASCDATVIGECEHENAPPDAPPAEDPAERLFEAARSIIAEIAREPIKNVDLAEALRVPVPLAKAWLERLVRDGFLQKVKKPAGYVISPSKLL